MSEQYEEQNTDSSGQDQTEGGGGGEGGGEENNEADMIFAPEASKPGRNAGMLMIAFVMIGVGVIYFMRARGGPQTALARPEVQDADRLIKGFDGNQVKKMKDLLENTQKVVDEFNKDRTSAQDDKKIENNYNPFNYHSPNEKPGESAETKDEREQARRKKIRKDKFADDVNGLKVQYVMVSNFAKTAMINNKLVQEGQEVEGFTIEKLTPNTVIVQRDGMRAEIKTNKEMK
jgi:hypothetical protein